MAAESGRHRNKLLLSSSLGAALREGNEFIAYIDAIGQLDGERSVIDWKTTASRYPEQPEGLLTLDPQLICYSWISGEPNVGFVVFVRKRLVEIRYLRATVTRSSATASARWSGAPFGKSKPPSSLPAAAFAFPRMAA